MTQSQGNALFQYTTSGSHWGNYSPLHPPICKYNVKYTCVYIYLLTPKPQNFQDVEKIQTFESKTRFCLVLFEHVFCFPSASLFDRLLRLNVVEMAHSNVPGSQTKWLGIGFEHCRTISKCHRAVKIRAPTSTYFA